jgi:hypothetical protein
MATYDSLAEYTKLKSIFPSLTDDNFRITSSDTNTYNCLAWVIDEDSYRVDPLSGRWGTGVVRTPTIEALMEVYEEHGFEECTDDSIEKGYVKIAIYAEPMTGRITHAAKQCPDGSWTSKLGDLQDINHDTPEVLQGGGYGTVQRYMRKRLPRARRRR